MADQAFPDALPAQYRLHWYVLERVLGQGGFGITYLARDTNLDQLVAIKEYLPVEVATRRADATVCARTGEQNERFTGGLEKFIREARTLARFDHPNIVRVHSVFEANGTAYMVMRFEEGETLAALLERRQALPEPDLMRLLLPILDGLELVHNAGFIHRDIKPDNIHIRSDGSPVLLDFGSARHALGQSRTLTILVAPGYAPFEQYYSGGESQGPWTDIYGLAATCYRAIVGRPPLDAITRSKGILGSTKEVLLPAAVAGSGRYSERLLKAVDHALSFAESERPQTVAAWRAELLGKQPAARSEERRGAAARVPKGSRTPLLWAAGGAGAAIAVAALLRWIPAPLAPKAAPADSAAAPAPDAKEESQRLALLEQKVAEDRKELLEKLQQSEAARKRLEEERSAAKAPRKAPPVASAPPRAPASPPAVPPVEPAAKPAPASAPASVPAAPTDAELLGRADQELARGNDAKAVETLRPLAARGNTRAMMRLGDLYSTGRGIERSDELALGMYSEASERGDSDAQLHLGDMYAKGQGVPQNNFLAYVWYSAAARSGNAAAKAGQERVAALLQSVEIQQATKLADRFARAAKDR